MTKKEQAKSDFIDRLGQMPLMDVNSMASIFNYMQNLNANLEKLYETAFDEGFKKAVNIDVNKN